MLRQQTLSLQTVQTASDLILNAQRQADQLRPNLHIEQTEHRIEHWLNRQDSLALTLIIVGLFCSLSLGTFIIAHLVTQPSVPAEVQHGH